MLFTFGLFSTNSLHSRLYVIPFGRKVYELLFAGAAKSYLRSKLFSRETNLAHTKSCCCSYESMQQAARFLLFASNNISAQYDTDVSKLFDEIL